MLPSRLFSPPEQSGELNMQRSYRFVSEGLFHEILLTFVELNLTRFNT
jgi:hypothetical protein